MFTRPKSCALAISVIMLITHSYCNADDQAEYTIDVQHSNEVLVQAFGAAPLVKRDSKPISLEINGDEKSECRVYGRKSHADGTAEANVNINPDGFSADILNSSIAMGGHYRTCGTCFDKNCIGVFGNNTSSRATSKTSINAVINFNPKTPKTSYSLNIGRNYLGEKPTIKITDHKGESTILDEKKIENLVIESAPGKSLSISIESLTSAQNEGGCCEEKKSSLAKIDIKLLREPILSKRNKLSPYIVGGEETDSFKNVGALVIGNRLHCTGTIIGPTTILTAAHCLQGYENQINNLYFILGSNISQPTSKHLKILAIDFPDDEKTGYKYNPSTYEDDIGIAYLESPIYNIDHSELHLSEPLWNWILEKKRSLIFVGFGYDVLKHELIGVGVKREASWRIDSVRNRTVSFSVPGKNTCKGDSGGPAFIRYNDSLIQVAITSIGDEKCTEGVETRVDAFYPWLKERIR
ncbi:S1 family peptidase [Pseudomonas anguilliseptica]|uniref:S1 family peptidase n=1 Tax=Pseudomonas anguilliseptica TaxID=53406 RepID=UPI0022B047B0|nr:trypsin-like serine protease [Pseudomonas anguilliseptica]MCZ4324496.1 trypsin-like serine protease [Pseudomonas anguilliseptica]